MFHQLAYTKLDTAGATNEDITGVTDQFATLQNGHYILQNDMKLIGAYDRNAALSSFRINTPHFRGVSIPTMRPINATAAVPSNPPYAWLPPSQLIIPRIDEVALEATNSGGGGVRNVGCIWVATLDHNLNLPQGDIFTLRATVSIAATAFVWSTGALTLDQTLPSGTYVVAGLEVVGATTEFARLVFQQYVMRPGVLTQLTLGGFDITQRFQHGRMGEWGRFQNTAQPALEVFATATATIAYTVFMDVIKVA